MKKLVITVSILAFLSGSICLFSMNKPWIFNQTKIKEEDKKPEENKPNPTPNVDKAKELLNNMTLDEKIGQMMYIAYRKPNWDNELKSILETVKPGGFIFFKENFNNTTQAKNLISEINQNTSIPLFLGIDEEGGRVQRLTSIEVNINIPPMLEIGNSNDLNLAYNTGKNIAQNLNRFGLNMDFAPVLDIFSNPKNTVIGNRSFGSNADIVSKMSMQISKALKDSRIIPVYKHFPGHGDTSTDSHYELPVIFKTKEELYQSELIPFQNAINNGAEIIMIGHLSLPNVTKNPIPASLSKEIITDLLKNEMGYKNLVITDALNMKAITKNYSTKEIYNLAINAGVDILLMPDNPKNALKEIKELINEKKITEEQINSSVYKILSLKVKYNII